ncbi:C-type isolectin Sp-CL4-like [Cebidichthys violaceus]|uniref:C-type isolectin Sp-CL4-like n=1 Tax=Cebidichthys violaceus TaxID=271503 RepID=UPI0035CCA623
MHPAVVTAVLLLVGTINTVTAISSNEIEEICMDQNLDSCSGGCMDADDQWIRLDKDRCMKYFEIPKTFKEAEDYCHSVNAELVSIHNEEENILVMCLSLNYISGLDRRPFWIGGKRSRGGFKYTDGSKFGYARWLPNQPDNHLRKECCVEMNAIDWGMWNDNRCSGKKDFVCQKRA